MLACAAGCTQTFGLDSAHDDDRDGDHIPDVSDNCPDVANHDQSRHDLSDPRGDACRVCTTDDPTDSDGDGIPDTCDGCDNRLPDTNHNGIPDACENPHDEDGDGVPDLVDNCPAVANPDQADTTEGMGGGPGGGMPDGVGDLCDDSIARDNQLFDSFAERNQLWLTSGEWEDGNDHSIVDMSSKTPIRIAGLGLQTFTASTAITVTGDGIAAVVALGSSGDNLRVTCGIASSKGHVFLAIDASNSTITFVAPKPIEITPAQLYVVKLAISPGGLASSQSVVCTLDGVDTLSMSLPVSNTVWHPGLSTTSDGTGTDVTGSAQFDFYDVVTNSP